MINSTIDALQTSNKFAITTLVKHDGLAETLHKIVDMQTDYSKNIVDTGFVAGNKLFNIIKQKGE